MTLPDIKKTNPIPANINGKLFLCLLKKENTNDRVAMKMLKINSPNSNPFVSRKAKPAKGNQINSMGVMRQCIPQKIDVHIPILSRFNLFI